MKLCKPNTPLDLVKVSQENKPNILKPVQDLIDIVDPLLECDWMIGGGFVRDWYQQRKFNDIDIYIFDAGRKSFKFSKFKEKLLASHRFRFLENSGDRFLDGIFYDRTQFEKKPRFQVQFMFWHSTPWNVLRGYDFDLSKFFIPFKGKDSRGLFENLDQYEIPYATPQALASIDRQEITFAQKTRKVIDSLKNSRVIRSDVTIILDFEKLIKRLGKFKSRGMSLPPDLSNTLDEILKAFDNKTPPTWYRSVLLEDANDYDRVVTESNYTPEEILRNAIEQFYLLLPEKDRYRFLTSPHHLAREVARDLL